MGLPPSLLSIGMASGQVSTASNTARQQADGASVRLQRPGGRWLRGRHPTYTLLMGLSLLCSYGDWLGAGCFEQGARGIVIAEPTPELGGRGARLRRARVSTIAHAARPS